MWYLINTIYYRLVDVRIEIYSAITRFPRDSMAQCSVLGQSQT